MSKKKYSKNQSDIFGNSINKNIYKNETISNAITSGEYSRIKWPTSGYIENDSFFAADIPEHSLEVLITRLSDFLEEENLREFNLSKKACLGIIERAKKRNKKMSSELEDIIKSYLDSLE